MKILQFCNKSPYPPLEGGPIAMNNLTKSLLNDGNIVKVFAINTNKYFVNINELPNEYISKTNYESVYVDLKINFVKAFVNLFSKKSLNVERFYTTKIQNKLIEILKNNKFDIIHIETIFLAPYLNIIRKYSDAKVVLRAHNIEHLIWFRLAKNEKNILKKYYLKNIAQKLKNFELEAINDFDGIITISKIDKKFLIGRGCKVPIKNIPFGIDTKFIDTNDKLNKSNENEKVSLFYIGSMNWLPNIEGLEWFFDNVWEKIIEKNLKIEFNIAGRYINQSFLNKNIPNVNIYGEVEDAHKFISDNTIMVVPLFSGSGIRIKIIEGMLHKKAIVTTSIGAEGINYRDGHDIVIADTIEDFVVAILKLIEDSDYRDIIGNNAYELIKTEHNMNLITPQLIEFYEQIIK